MDASPGIARKELLDAVLDRSTGVARVHVSQVQLGPGQAPGLHRHPCAVVGTVLAGTIRFQPAGGPETVLTAGDAFHEPALASIARFDNASGTEPASFVACYLLPAGEDRLIETLEPPSGT